MNCEHCLKNHALDCGPVHTLHRVGAALQRGLRALLASLAQLG